MKQQNAFKKMFSLLLALAMLLSLAACGETKAPEKKTDEKAAQTGSEKPADNGAAEKDTAKDAPKEAPVEIQIVSSAQPDVDARIVKMVEEKYNVKFNWDWVVDNKKFNEIMGVKLSAGEMPDFVMLPDSGDINKYIKQGLAAEITPEMQAKIPTYFEVVEKYDENNNMWVDAKRNGKLYGLKPISSQGAYPTVLIWRTDWLKNVGINEIPKTLEEFEKAMYAFKEKDPDKDGQANTYGLSETAFDAVFGAFGAIPLKTLGKGRQVLFITKNEAGELAFACTRPEMKEALAKLQQYYKDGVIDTEFVTGENTGGYLATSHAFINGRIGVTGKVLPTHWNPPYDNEGQGGAVYQEMLAANPNAKFGETFDIGTAIEGPHGKSGLHKWGAVNSNIGVFTTKCVQDERKTNALLQLIEDTFTDYDFYLLLTKGIEGVHYTKNADGKLVRNSTDFPKDNDLRKDGVYIFELLQQPDFRKKALPDYYEFIEKYNGPSYTDEMYPKTESYSKNISALERLTVETYMSIITGEKPADYFDEYVKLFYENGGTAIEQEMNAQVKENLGK